MERGIFVDGEPVLSGGNGQESWQDQIRARVDPDLTTPQLTFVVSGLKRRGHVFDLDNLVHPVLMVFSDPVNGVQARLVVGSRPGLLIEDDAFGTQNNELLRSLYVPAYSQTSARDRIGIPEIADDPVFDEHEGLGISLRFDSNDVPIRQGWFGPTEAVIDDLTPWFGVYTQREMIADHRIRDLRIVRGVNPDADGVEIGVWYVPDESVSISKDIQARIERAD